MAASNSERLSRPSASVSATLKSRPDTPDASLESTYPLPSRSIERKEPEEPDAPEELDGEEEVEPELPDGDEEEPLLIEPDELPDAPDLSPAATATPDTADRAKAKSTALLRNFI